MKNWIKNREDFIRILCELPLSIHTNNSDNYMNFAVKKNKSEIHIIEEVNFKFINMYLYYDFNRVFAILMSLYNVFIVSLHQKIPYMKKL